MNAGPDRHPMRAVDHALAWLLAAATVVLLANTSDMGFTRDESFYFASARAYAGWFAELEDNASAGSLRESFTQESIDRHWSDNAEHPVLVKTAFALSHRYLHERTGLLSPSAAMRLPAWLFTGWLVGAMYVFTRRAYGSRPAAVLAPALLLTVPRFFFHAHLTCFDVPMTAVWFAFVYAYWRSLDSTCWAWVTGVMWGVALSTKLNAFFLPLVILAHWGIRALRGSRADRGGRLHVPPVPFALFAMALVGPVLFVAMWPRHWFDTLARIGWYLNFHLRHEHYFISYFGEALIRPPFPVSFPFVMSATTTPLPALAAFVGGAALLLWRWREDVARGWSDPRATGLLIALNIAIPFAIIARPSTPIFGGIKHWFPALPFVCIVAALGLVELARVLGPVLWRRAPERGAAAVMCGAATLVLSVSVLETAQIHPYGTSHYNALVGYTTGAADRRGQRQFWGYASRGVLDWLNAHVEPGQSVHFQNTTGGAVEMYQREGWLRDDLRVAWTLDGADWFVLHHQKSFAPLQYQVWDRFGTMAPVHTLTVRGVPLISIYRNERRLADAR